MYKGMNKLSTKRQIHCTTV